MRIPISLSCADQWCWRGDVRGVYTVKQGYRLQMEGVMNEPFQFTAWRVLWQTKLPPTILNFVWRCGRDVLPTRMALAGRGINVDPLCPLCHSFQETPLHLFKLCSHTCRLWDAISDLPMVCPGDSFAAWLSKVIEGRKEVVVRECLALCWSIWKCRNDLLWSNKTWEPGEVVRRSNALLVEWSMVQTASGITLNDSAVHAVAPTTDNGITIHVDAAVFPNREEGFVSAVVHASDGRFLAARNSPVRSLRDPVLAEAMAIKEALSWAKDCGWQVVAIYSDCQVVCNLLKDTSPSYSYSGCVVSDCIALKRYFVDVSFHFVSRSSNTLAHALARATASRTGSRTWFFAIPDCIQRFLLVN
ncbi:uncharacterized protein LOC116005682 [Ipomoea triloba]|uniref:uncharacterized protein LOC116005682 n=1 Tax=Ipomoea triloba TaxID=35885 RepID=UPI00125E2922|nr:uncharacterized protein LOC116005682 [Ipomoea triloba]